MGPKNHATVAPGAIEFHWTRVEGAASYEFELSDSPDFAKVLLRRIDLDESGLSLTEALDEGTHYWRVGAVDGAGGRSGFSQVREFSVRQAQDRDTSHLRHPYLFFSADDIPSIRQRLDTTCAAAWKGILSQAEAALTADMPDEKNILLGSRKNGGFQKLNMEYGHNMLLPLSFAYAITRDSRYAAKARQILLFLVGMSKWTGVQFGDVQAFYPAWTATLETAMLARHAAPAYDWIYDYLDDDDRARIRAGLLRLAILPLLQSWCDPRTIKYIPRHQTAAGNWWSVCNGGGGLAALAVINEILDARGWVSGFADSIRDFLSYKGGDIFDIHLRAGHGDQDLQRTEPNWYEDGGYEESTGYAHFGLVYSLCFLYALRRVTGEDLSGFINPRAIDFPYYFGYPSRGGGWPNVAFNDNSGPWSDDILALLTSLTGSGRARYILQAGWPDIKNITAVIAVDTSVPALPPDDSDRNKLLPDTGWCVCRSGWDTEASLLAAKFHQGRGHHDIGQYVINFRGREFVVDSGTVSYTDPTYGGYGRTSRAHNLVLVDGQDQIRVDGSILGFAETPGAAIVEADLTDAYQDL
ncbi:MAG TPA: heparinase II/III family protein, partial [Candidatus Cryosericum sp.]